MDRAGHATPCPCGSGQLYEECCSPRAHAPVSSLGASTSGASLTVAATVRAARDHLRRGALAEAEAVLTQVPPTEPGHAEAWHDLGDLAVRAGRLDLAVESLRRALAGADDVARYHSDLGYLLWQVGDAVGAAAACRAALQRDPTHVAALNNLGLALQAQGDLMGALASFREALRLQPAQAGVHANLGLALQAQGDLAGAIAQYRQAIRLAPDVADGYQYLATALAAQGDLEAAIAQYHAALRLQPTYALAHDNLGFALQQQGDLRGAIAAYAEAVRLVPGFAHAYNNLGNALREQGQLPAAIACLEQTLRLEPGFVGAHNNLGLVLAALGDMAGAIAHFREELRVQPDSPAATVNLLRPLQEVGEWSQVEALATRTRRALQAQPPAVLPPYTLLTIPSTPAEQLACARNWVADRLAPVERLRPALGFQHTPAPRSQLRIGYLSSDFRDHAVAYLIAELIELHDREQFAVYGYALGVDDGSALRQRLAHAFDRFIDLHVASSVEAARRIHDDGIDILVDLNGHTRGSRTEILALRPAPIQVSYLGYPGTMGAGFIDYLITDRFLTPPDQQPFFTETFAYLPDTYQPNDRQRAIAEATPTRHACGLPDEGLVFCCFNNPYKITPAMFDIWMRLLDRTPGSVLWLVAGNQLVSANLRREAAARGLDSERLVFAARRPYAEYLARYRLADLFLDTLPYNAGATASDALWAGLPVLTCAGETYVSRMAGSLLHAVGLPELVTTSLEEYEALALALARDPARLATLRARLAATRETAPLFDTPRYTRHLEDAYHTMWRALPRHIAR